MSSKWKFIKFLDLLKLITYNLTFFWNLLPRVCTIKPVGVDLVSGVVVGDEFIERFS